MSTSQASSDPMGQLLKEYCPPLDSAIVLAILLDYDNVEDARDILDTLKAETIVDEADGADLSDFNNYNVFTDEDTNTTLTSVSKSEKGAGGDREITADDPVYPLTVMFPSTAVFTLRHTLQKCGSDVDRAIDELLNLGFLDGEGEGLKGVEAFSEDSMHLNSSRRKGKKKVNRQSQSGNILEELDAAGGGTAPSKWEQMETEVTFLATKLNVPPQIAKSAYHKHGSLSSTLVALIESHGEGDTIPEDASHLENISSIMAKHPRLLQSHVVGLVKMCKDDIPSAFKFAELLNRRQLHKLTVETTPQTPNPKSPTSSIVPSSDPWNFVVSPRRTPTSPRSPTSPRMSYRTAALTANDHAAARNEAYNKASAAYRRSKSDHLMGAVATYYAEEGKNHGTRLKAYSHMAAEALVNENSTEYTLDLHGVTVQQALKITNERVTSWWVQINSNDTRAVIPFNIITGIGTHSKGGQSRLGPAVSKMLIKGNWKIEVRPGNIMVLGVQKK
ncbi:hypothetical protein AOL_s00004g392 [Orbilia oligospora ATCC 24927]|uniref:Smr domain-containing protein n=1 Tax=Arthrobotrys oligospora (strain ATCC 24927 / CBS 115.81 / DSM 1491) TaxID=756982 RepID=G1WYN1_ARTOA|nr:hypothetical protein AOL_s00004g392 [Orbilia oligospora ATCC 24927]EGX53733.1 hypothetical protein AOL_s00004g392 [Orbilia oligospora ATCC 24927]